MALDTEEKIVPVHVAIIPDGNRRWAREKGLPVPEGHRKGAERFKKTVRDMYYAGVKFVTFYAFSTENWKREKTEVEALMKLLGYFLENFKKELGDDYDKVRIRVIGNREELSAALIKKIEAVEGATLGHSGIIVNIAINYGGREELCHAIKGVCEDIMAGKADINNIDEKLVDEHLYTAGMPDPDLLIRTSGEERISNYLLWQLAYTEFYFADVYWPDFDKNEMEKAFAAFAGRKRRFGN